MKTAASLKFRGISITSSGLNFNRISRSRIILQFLNELKWCDHDHGAMKITHILNTCSLLNCSRDFNVLICIFSLVYPIEYLSQEHKEIYRQLSQTLMQCPRGNVWELKWFLHPSSYSLISYRPTRTEKYLATQQ
jgi:hypothetical protein